MKHIRRAIALSTLVMTFGSGLTFAQDHNDNHEHGNQSHHDSHSYVRHSEWKKGSHINHSDWNRGTRIDYRHYRLHQPPRGYEWREVDGNYVLAAVATGVIASVIVASAAH